MTRTLQEWIDTSSRIVLFGGAGLSTESGIPDYRSVDGLYQGKYAYPPERMLSHSFFMEHPDEFYAFYKDKLLHLEARPNAAHRKLAELEAAGKLSGIVTQNVDGLHQAAGSRAVFELHGSVHRNHCMQCGKRYDGAFIAASAGVPTCTCGGTVRPDVVLYEEGLDARVLSGAQRVIEAADLLIVAGTSLAVYPAAGLLQFYRGARLVLINRDPSAADARANLVLHGNVGEILDKIEVRGMNA